MSFSSSRNEKAVNTIECVSKVHSTTDLIDYSEEEEKALVRKLDRIILPIMCLVYFCQYLDKQTLSYAAVFGLKTDLKLTGNQYSWLTSAFYISQLVSQIWNSFALSKFPIKIVTGISIFVWGALCMCLAAPNDFPAFVAVRALLGFFEGAVSPSFVIITSVYYKKSEHPIRTAAWVSCNALAQIVGNFLVYGIAKNTSIALAPWRVTFLICGAITLLIGAVFYFFIPFSPSNAWFLNERERHIAVNRLLAESDRGEKQSFNFQQILDSFKFDWITISSFLFGFLITATSGPIVFSSLYLENMGYDNFEVVEYGSPSGALQFIVVWIGALFTYLFPKERCFVIMFLILVPLTGNIVLLALPSSNHWGGIVGAWLGSCITSFMCILLSLNASNTRGNTRKAIVNNVFFLGYCLAAIVYPQWWNYSKDPTYRAGLSCNVAFWVLLEALIFGYRYMCIRENNKRDRLHNEGKIPDYDPTVDLTDREDLHHRYSY